MSEDPSVALPSALLPAAVVLLIVLPLVALIVMYNRFVRQRTLVEESWSQIDVELQRRHDLIPQLVSVVRGYAEHERAVLEQLTRAREEATAHRADGPAERRPYEESVGRALRSVVARAEAYPDLKASANFLQLQDELSHTEDRIAASRRFYNGNVRALNTRVGTFPSNLVASSFGFTRREFFELTEPGAARPPQPTDLP
ncbi:LemA family protein [Nocardioides sp.]|uniref:LemA family protein n=1 Tax=Nocardioides sp. TaxID=35761 RepID=UPI00273356DE|nr:LemA family protein [Nocardioides sp.]MDP3892476.1 LemA family protein [Nocardioides sp.]